MNLMTPDEWEQSVELIFGEGEMTPEQRRLLLSPEVYQRYSAAYKDAEKGDEEAKRTCEIIYRTAQEEVKDFENVVHSNDGIGSK